MVADFIDILDNINITPPSCNSEKRRQKNRDYLCDYFEQIYLAVHKAYANLDDLEAKQNYPQYLKKTEEIERQRKVCLDCKSKYRV